MTENQKITKNIRFNFEIETEIKKNAMFLHTEIGSGNLGKTKVRFIDVGSRYVLEERKEKNDWLSYIIPKDKLIMAIAESILKTK